MPIYWGTMIMIVQNFIPMHSIFVEIIQSGIREVDPPANQQHHPNSTDFKKNK